ncbi:DUF3108 domain-containing protein [Consotaella salsifontis]|uniref:DUF3108 domain-containing protein n=1 Tax=Consotaella salsifontis TaxID=1365950 RepID=A0A1T4RQS5_9HYPH|nr:DUF3108 domain-containing protein [Consotaella salsifontis]SKA18314.1 Protein of unknown function [Consotaella salsifontis]
MVRTTTLSILLAAAILQAPAARAESTVYSTRYSFSLIGFRVGEAKFETTAGGETFDVKGTLSSAGLADLFAPTEGTATSAGSAAASGELFPTSFTVAYKSGKKSWSSKVKLDHGRAVSVEATPNPSRGKKKFVPVAPEDLKIVADPLSGLMIPAASDPDAICRRTIPYFDGWQRFDLELSPSGRHDFKTDGFSGEAIGCTVRLKAVSGINRASKQLKFLEKSAIDIWFAPIGTTGLYAPVYLKAPTEIGPLTMKAATFAKPIGPQDSAKAGH